MLDIKFIRENEALVKENLKKRREPEKIKLLENVIKTVVNQQKEE